LREAPLAIRKSLSDSWVIQAQYHNQQRTRLQYSDRIMRSNAKIWHFLTTGQLSRRVAAA